jgi:hypothetical protein
MDAMIQTDLTETRRYRCLPTVHNLVGWRYRQHGWRAEEILNARSLNVAVSVIRPR